MGGRAGDKVAGIASMSHIAKFMTRPLKTPKLACPLSTAASKEVEVVQSAGVRFVTLNRPKALNALSLPMVRSMYPLYRDWMENENVRLIVQEGAGEKAFCAGGDVASLYRAKK